MLHREYQTQVCSVARSLEVVGERWSLLIVRSVLQGVVRFDDLKEALGITRSVLTTRLQHLCAEGVLERTPYSDRPPRFEYRVTEKGAELWPLLAHLLRWGDKYYPEPAGAPLLVEHAECGGAPDGNLVCDRCGTSLRAADVEVRPGPGSPAVAAG